MSESINLGLLNRVAAQYELEFGEYQHPDEHREGDFWVQVKNGNHIEDFIDIQTAFCWFKGYERGYADGVPDPIPSGDG